MFTADDTERAGEVGSEAVRGEQQLTPPEALKDLGGRPPVPSAVPVPMSRGFYGKTEARQGVHQVRAQDKRYDCADCVDLEARIRKAFKDMGYEF